MQAAKFFELFMEFLVWPASLPIECEVGLGQTRLQTWQNPTAQVRFHVTQGGSYVPAEFQISPTAVPKSRDACNTGGKRSAAILAAGKMPALRTRH
jgi:hypothetical protein